MSGYRDCSCCGTAIIADLTAAIALCGDCHTDGSECIGDHCEHDGCDYTLAHHCFTGYCDGSGCTYEGECEPAHAQTTTERGRT